MVGYAVTCTADTTTVQQRAPGFQVFYPGSVISHGYGAYVDFDIEVSVCGLTVQPGDLLHGDENGLVQVPPLLGEVRRCFVLFAVNLYSRNMHMPADIAAPGRFQNLLCSEGISPCEGRSLSANIE